MRHTLISIAILVSLGAAARLAIGQPKGARATIRGEVVDLWCYLEGGDRGAANKECATACARAGNPIGILDAKGNLYVAAGLNDHQPAQAILIDRMTDQVTVTGTVVKKGGLQMIYVDSVTPLATAQPEVDRAAITNQVRALWDHVDGLVDRTVDYFTARRQRLTSMLVGG
jgi:hypothetical protein